MNKNMYKLLVVEDNQLISSGIKAMLTMEGFTVFTASNGLEGLEKLKQKKPDLILSDIMMPKMNGYEFYKKILENSSWAKIPFIFLTSQEQKEDIRKGKRLGVDDYLLKDTAPEDLIATIYGKINKAQILYSKKNGIDNLIHNRYKIIQTVGKGATAIVYKAIDLDIHNRTVAIKELIFSNDISPKDKKVRTKLFDQEAKILSQLNHPNIPPIYDFFFENSKFYIVMEFLDGSTLLKKIQNTKFFFPESDILSWALQIADALRLLHKKNIIFRDLKPANIILTKNGFIKLIDFGIARFFKKAQYDTVVAYTPSYAPPEQILGITDFRSDIFSFGATLYHLTTLEHQKKNDIKDIREININISNQFALLIEKCTQTKPELRFQNMDSLYSALFHMTESR